MPVSLSTGANLIELDVQSAQNGSRSFVKTINFDPSLSTASRRLLYVSSIAQGFSGTIVIDVDSNIFLGFIKDKHVRGISPDGKLIYMDDRSVISTATHQELPPPASPLAFSQTIPSDGFLVAPDGTRLYSRDEVLDVATNHVLADKLPASIKTGNSYAGPNQGGPAISADGKTILFGPDSSGGIGLISIASNSVTYTGISYTGSYLSDIRLTRDGTRVLVSSYGGTQGAVEVFDVSSFRKLASISLSDFTGQVLLSRDGTKALLGSAGNPNGGPGRLAVVDTTSFQVDQSLGIDLADHLAISDRNEVFVSTGGTPGIAEFALQPDGTLNFLREFFIGINQYAATCCYRAPQEDDIEKIVFKPSY